MEMTIRRASTSLLAIVGTAFLTGLVGNAILSALDGALGLPVVLLLFGATAVASVVLLPVAIWFALPPWLMDPVRFCLNERDTIGEFLLPLQFVLPGILFAAFAGFLYFVGRNRLNFTKRLSIALGLSAPTFVALYLVSRSLLENFRANGCAAVIGGLT